MRNTQDLSGYGVERDDEYNPTDEIDFLKSENRRLQNACDQQDYEITQILAEVLGYSKGVPGNPEEYNVGEHTAVTLAIEVARRIKRDREGICACPECGGESKDEIIDEDIHMETPVGVIETSCRYKIRRCQSCEMKSYPAVSLFKRDAVILGKLLDRLRKTNGQDYAK